MGRAHLVLCFATASGRHLRWEIRARAVGLNQKDAESRLERGPRSTGLCFRRFRAEGHTWNVDNQGAGCRCHVGCSVFWSSRHRDRRYIRCGHLAAGANHGSLLKTDWRHVRGHSRVAHCHLLHYRHRNAAGGEGGRLRDEQCDRQCNR